ncbi:DUF1800 domain-containing protein [Shimia abyssi]|uniref:Uncharacterized protein (DUF1800 family) n=1 Tax=Shimia abyssi TaxID=1662395 RepID=A0A2P8FJQ5_9RHOB|nr:DUF1800 domain-containing protein [Shimia abyssi]PSL21951.1 uncharacterized protein (DUF1800 family) [Shimia abyssi]
MSFDSILAQTRFGFGPSPLVQGPESAGAMIATLKGADRGAEMFAIPHYHENMAQLAQFAHLTKQSRALRRDGKETVEVDRQMRVLNRTMAARRRKWIRQVLMRATWSEDALRERLGLFWFDHFAARGKRRDYAWMGAPYVETAIRPFISGLFEDLLISAVTHPMMLHFLDQSVSLGPNSRLAKNQRVKGKKRGLNENLAREILELHTLGVNGPYSQQDVRQLAELLTGLVGDNVKGTQFQAGRAEPGAEAILGVTYGGSRRDGLRDIEGALRDLARHPSTAKHLARKLATHFVSDRPSDDLVTEIEWAYRESGGDLSKMYLAILTHPDAWRVDVVNTRRPIEFVGAAFRALAVPPESFISWSAKQTRTIIETPMRLMGQDWLRPPGPQGWPEADDYWLTPQGVAARLQWALAAPMHLVEDLPDPRDLMQTALGGRASERTVQAVNAAQNRQEGVALVLMAPQFQKR